MKKVKIINKKGYGEVIKNHKLIYMPLTKVFVLLPYIPYQSLFNKYKNIFSHTFQSAY